MAFPATRSKDGGEEPGVLLVRERSEAGYGGETVAGGGPSAEAFHFWKSVGKGNQEVVEMVSERVLVVPTWRFRQLGYFQGFSGEVERYVPALLEPEYLSYRPRSEVEQDPSWKQLIPYVIFLYRDPVQGQMLFQYTRGVGQGEGRLHHKRSVGVGGHISASDAANGAGDPFGEGMRRELDEEVIIGTSYRLQCVGLINDDLTEVGRVHLGLVHLAEVDAPAVYPREKDICQSGFQPVGQLLQEAAAFETWSQLCLEGLFGQHLGR